MPPLTRAARPFSRTHRRRAEVRALATVAVLAIGTACGDGPSASDGASPPVDHPLGNPAATGGLGNPAATGGNISGTFVLRQVQGAALPWFGRMNNGAEMTISNGTLTIAGEQRWEMQYGFNASVDTDGGAVTRNGSGLAFRSASRTFVGVFSDSTGTVALHGVDVQHGDLVLMTFVRQ